MLHRKDLIFPALGDGNSILFIFNSITVSEGFDIPRLRGRKLFWDYCTEDASEEGFDIPRLRGRKHKTAVSRPDDRTKDLIFPALGDGNSG